MTHWDEELEQALCRSTTQVLHLAGETGPRDRTLAERAADLVRGFDSLPLNGSALLADATVDLSRDRAR